MARKRKTLEEFFWLRVQKSDGCWLWTGRLTTPGYGDIVLGRGGKRIGAHRASWEIHNGPIGAGLFVCHTCDTPACVNPAHLFLGTQKDNLQDASQKGRMSVPGKGWKTRITHCPQGHEYTEDNTYTWKTRRICRKCHAAHEAQRRSRLENANCGQAN